MKNRSHSPSTPRGIRRRPSLESLERRCLLAALTDDQLVYVSALQAQCATTTQEVVYYEDFENGLGGFTADNTGGTLPGLWHHSLGRRADGQPNHSPQSSFYYGLFETASGGGRYDTLPFDHQGVLYSPPITLPVGTNTLMFNYFLATRLPTDVDFVDVSIIDVGTPGSAPVPLLTRDAGTLHQTGTTWEAVCAELPEEFSNKTIQVLFRFDTGNVVNIDPEGWYVDDVLITNLATADLSISKSVDDDSPDEDQLITYTLTATNGATSQVPATGVTVNEILPAGVTFVSSSSPDFDPITHVWTIGDLPAGVTETLTISATVNAGTAGNGLVNVATINGDQVDPDPTDNTTTQTSTVNSVDLSVTKSVDDETPNIGQSVTYTIQAFNAATSNAAATGVSVLEMLPSQVTFVSASSVDFNPVTQVWTVGDLPAGAMKSLQITVIVNEGLADACVANTVTISGSETDPDLSNNMFTQMLTPNHVDLSITKTTDNEKPNVGQNITYTLTATNASTSNVIATGVKVQETLPSGVTYASASSPDFDPITQVWMVGELAIGETKALMITASVNPNTAGELLNNTVTINGNETDPDPSNNMVTQTSTVNGVDISVVKNANNLTPTEGERVTFTITVHNDIGSNNDASGVVVTDALPSGVTFVSSSATEGSYDNLTHQWTGVDLLRDETQTLTIVVDINAGAGGTAITNTATLEANETDPDLANNKSSVNLAVAQDVHFIAPLSVYRPGAFVLPADERLAILGRLWNDVNDNGSWDADEEAIDGATIELVDDTSTVITTTQTRAVDLNQDGEFDNVAERGLYWFHKDGNLPAGTYQVRLVLPNGVPATVAKTPVEYTVEIGSASPSLVSIPLTNVSPNFGVNLDFVTVAATGRGAIIGHSWADLDLDGTWDDNEKGRYGFAFYLDLDKNNQFDPETEPQAVTGQDGKYVFLDVAPGDYVVREVPSQTLPISVQTFPAIDASDSDPLVIKSEVNVTVVSGSVKAAGFKETALPNLGSFDYSTFVRPADQFATRANSSLAAADLVSALKPWQSFKLENTTGETLQITGIDTAGINGLGIDYVSVMQFDGGSLVPVIPDFELAVGQAVEYMVFYDPAKRDESGDVISQSPDWLGSKTAVHTFAVTDKLVVKTSLGLEFSVKLIGGSTYDSDVTHDGVVDLLDFLTLDQLLSLEPVIEELANDGTRSPRFDPTMDVNARCPNGAESVTGTCSFALGGTPSREIALGDFGPLNQEFGLPGNS